MKRWYLHGDNPPTPRLFPLDELQNRPQINKLTDTVNSQSKKNIKRKYDILYTNSQTNQIARNRYVQDQEDPSNQVWKFLKPDFFSSSSAELFLLLNSLRRSERLWRLRRRGDRLSSLFLRGDRLLPGGDCRSSRLLVEELPSSLLLWLRRLSGLLELDRLRRGEVWREPDGDLIEGIESKDVKRVKGSAGTYLDRGISVILVSR